MKKEWANKKDKQSDFIILWLWPLAKAFVALYALSTRKKGITLVFSTPYSVIYKILGTLVNLIKKK